MNFLFFLLIDLIFITIKIETTKATTKNPEKHKVFAEYEPVYLLP